VLILQVLYKVGQEDNYYTCCRHTLPTSYQLILLPEQVSHAPTAGKGHPTA